MVTKSGISAMSNKRSKASESTAPKTKQGSKRRIDTVIINQPQSPWIETTVPPVPVANIPKTFMFNGKTFNVTPESKFTPNSFGGYDFDDGKGVTSRLPAAAFEQYRKPTLPPAPIPVPIPIPPTPKPPRPKPVPPAPNPKPHPKPKPRPTPTPKPHPMPKPAPKPKPIPGPTPFPGPNPGPFYPKPTPTPKPIPGIPVPVQQCGTVAGNRICQGPSSGPIAPNIIQIDSAVSAIKSTKIAGVNNPAAAIAFGNLKSLGNK